MTLATPRPEQTVPEPDPVPLRMVHDLPGVQLAQREQLLVDLCRGQRVIHVGFADEGMRSTAQRTGGWLHARLGAVARELVGLDIEPAGVEEARARGYEAHVVDCCDREQLRRLSLPRANLVVAGETLEHVHAAGPFLTAMHELVLPGGRLVVTTPNATRLLHFAATATGREVMHPDHVQVFSWYTLTNLLTRHGWEVTEFSTYLWPHVAAAQGSMGWKWGSINRLQRAAARFVSPFFADGLIAVCRPVGERSRP